MNSLRTVLSYVAGRVSLFVSCILAEIRLAIHDSRFTKLLLLPILLSGCGIYMLPAPKADYYYLNPDKDLSTIGRVFIIELDNNSSYPAIGDDVTKALFEALQKKQVFGLTVVRQSDPAWRNLQLDVDPDCQLQNSALAVPSAYTLEQLSAIRKTLRCDAILIGTITAYQPYPHLGIGLRLKLVDLKDGQLLWALEQIWDSADKTTENRAKIHFGRKIRLGSPPLSEQLITVSSLKFIKFVAYEVAETIQPER